MAALFPDRVEPVEWVLTTKQGGLMASPTQQRRGFQRDDGRRAGTRVPVTATFTVDDTIFDSGSCGGSG